ncbi:relaxase/mobilization nuclease domain-containing protein [Dorea formicigenerans]|uniref:relaxase/mobilization nuclease domain-containing protein n=1 Tax=Dorea formicigenerans TaxID=39486 RepID=UPI0022E67A2C|nr:relaxase/mobilization nuclease domain-containing protein [Dorea formicigenerans]
MAATRFISMHKSKGKTPAVSLSERVAYILNPTKTDGGRLVSAHGCDPATAAAEMLLTRRQYLDAGGWVPGNDKEVLAYHIRQAFKPGEITPEDANRIGRELAERFTKGRYQFIVATHIDRGHVHNHIIFAAVSEDAGRRFRDFLGTAKAVRKISDRLCLENGLSVIENPKRGRKDYGKWLGDQRPLSAQEKVRDAIDVALAQRRGSSLSFLAPGQEKATRCRKKTLGDDYTPEAIQERIEGRRVVSSSRSKAPAKPARKVNLLIDIQSKLQAGKGAGYAQWAKVFNLKQMAQTISFLEENGLLEYDALAARAAEGTARFNELSGTIKRTEGRMAEIAALQKQIVNYSKTRDVYAAYRKAGYSKKFLAAHETEILLHKAAKAAFDKLCLQKLPTYKTLQAEYAGLLAEKKKAYAEYAAAKKEMQAVLTAKANVDRLLGAPPERPEQEKEQAQR